MTLSSEGAPAVSSFRLGVAGVGLWESVELAEALFRPAKAASDVTVAKA